MKVAYILYNERPMSGLLRGQVIAMLCELAHEQRNLDLTVICFWQPFLFFTGRRDMQEMTALFSLANISVENYYICPPNRFFVANRFLFRILTEFFVTIFRRVIGARFDVVHSRAYYASFFASKIKLEMGFSLIFDMRSLFPDEMLASGKVMIGSQQYQLWKSIEQHTLERTDFSVVVSKAMKDKVISLCPSTQVVHIPLCVDTQKYSTSLQSREEVKKELGIRQSRIIGYCGSLSLDFNNDLMEYGRYMLAIYMEHNDTHFLIVTQSTSLNIKKLLCAEGIPEVNITVRKAKGHELVNLLSCCDAGIFVMKPGADRDTRLGVKFVEYLAVGLPVIANVNVGAAAKIIKDNRLGTVLDLDTNTNIRSSIEDMFVDSEKTRTRCHDYAVLNYDTKIIASRYRNLYLSIGSMVL